MDLEILNFGEALKFVPKKNSYAIRIEGAFDMYVQFNHLTKSEKWKGISHYHFDDKWPSSWKEYSWYDTKCEEFQKYLKEEQREYPKMTEESLMSYLEGRGHPYGRVTLFDDEFANKILDDFEKVKDLVDCVMVHCIEGRNRSPAVGIAMNEIYDWGIEGLKEKFPSYRRFVYQKMIDVAKKR